MRLVVNGEKREFSGDPTITGLLVELGLAEKKVAVELNRSVIEKTEWESTDLSNDDDLEIVHFVGGG
jgi:thiamine biosynthesis protein ThiS